MGRRLWPLHRLLVLGIALLVLLLSASTKAGADPGTIPLYHYGIGDGQLGQPTAFADSWMRPEWMPGRVRWDWPGVALADLPPGTLVHLMVAGLPEWAATWPELDEIVGRSTIAYVADRPGDDCYGDAWWTVFGKLAPHWVGVVYVEVEVLWQPEVAAFAD